MAEKKPTPTEVKWKAISSISITLLDAFKTACRWIGAVAIGGWVYLSIAAMSGRDTTFKSQIDWAINANIGLIMSTGAALVFGAGFVAERRTRLKYVAETATRMAELERRLHPDRTSSADAVSTAAGKDAAVQEFGEHD